MAYSTYVNTVVSIVAATPATFDSSGFAALSWSAVVGHLVKWDSPGDTSEELKADLLQGRVDKLNGIVDGGNISFEYEFELADAGQVILRANSNGATYVSIKELDPDGKIYYRYGVVADVVFRPKTSKTRKGQSGVIRISKSTTAV